MNEHFIGLYSAEAEKKYGSVTYVDGNNTSHIVTAVYNRADYREGGDPNKPSVFEHYRWNDAKIVSACLTKYTGKNAIAKHEYY